MCRGSRVRLQVDTDQLDAVLRSLSESGVRSLTSTPPTLEELFLRHYQDEAGDRPGSSEAESLREAR